MNTHSISLEGNFFFEFKISWEISKVDAFDYRVDSLDLERRGRGGSLGLPKLIHFVLFPSPRVAGDFRLLHSASRSGSSVWKLANRVLVVRRVAGLRFGQTIFCLMQNSEFQRKTIVFSISFWIPFNFEHLYSNLDHLFLSWHKLLYQHISIQFCFTHIRAIRH